jgi:hypothetical protein
MTEPERPYWIEELREQYARSHTHHFRPPWEWDDCKGCQADLEWLETYGDDPPDEDERLLEEWEVREEES